MKSIWDYVPLWVKALCIILFGMIASGLLTTVMVDIPTPLTPGSRGDWVSFFGNISGGIIGGLVAYFVAKAQVDEQISQVHIRKLEQRTKEYISQLPALVSMKVELQKVESGLNMAKVYVEKHRPEQELTAFILAQILSRDFMRNIPTVKHNNWEGIWNLHDPDLLVDLLKLKDFYDDFAKYTVLELDKIKFPTPADYVQTELKKRDVWERYLAEDFHTKISMAIAKIDNSLNTIKEYRSRGF